MRLAALGLGLALVTSCGERTAPMTDVRALPPVNGHGLRLAAGYTAVPSDDGWLIEAEGAGDTRHPVRIEVTVRRGAAPQGGAAVTAGGRRLRRVVSTVPGGSSGEGRLLVYRETLGASHAEYRQLAYADGLPPEFILDDLIRGGGLRVTSGG